VSLKSQAKHQEEMKHLSISLFCTIITLFGLYKFSTSFFLAKKSLSHLSSCDGDTAMNLLEDVLHISPNNIQRLLKDGILSQYGERDGVVVSNGCWMPRKVDAIALIVVDALRFDFALKHLPKSVGARLASKNKLLNITTPGLSKLDHTGSIGQSQLFQFVADPPTVTMQRLKGLTTGGLPTFADVSGSFGGANIDEDSWVQQLHDIPYSKRGLSGTGENHAKMAFVGDDTWVDLFPHQFHDSHPFPSFNTRDLDTVDNGCLLHLPRLLNSFGQPGNLIKNGEQFFFEVIVTHFLGVDHVGHTYGPHNIHMDKKLTQIDNALDVILSKIDDGKHVCQVAFVFGDHGMTEDGNHGGGTKNEINAALFAHFSPGCGDFTSSFEITGSEIGSHSEKSFLSVNQIDLVPTISLLLGLPVSANYSIIPPNIITNNT